MSARFDRSGVSFAYPDNWLLEEEPNDDASVSVSVASPNTAFWTLVVYDEKLDPTHVADQALEALRQEYTDLEASTASDAVAGVPLTGHDVDFICLDLTNTARIRAWQQGDATYLTFCQCEDRELEEVDLVFQAITTSLLASGE